MTNISFVTFLSEKFSNFPIDVIEKDATFSMPSENDDGHIEYKKTLMLASEQKLQQYATQMIWRIGQNLDSNQAVYYIGVEDDGKICGLTQDQVVDNIGRFVDLCKIASTTILNLEIFTTDTKFLCLHIIVHGKSHQEFDYDFGDSV
jgi:GTPase